VLIDAHQSGKLKSRAWLKNDFKPKISRKRNKIVKNRFL